MQKYLQDPANRERHRARIRKNNRKYRDDVQELVLEFKKSGCVLCGETEPCCLSAHHRNTKTKKFTIGDRTKWHSLAAIIKELKKCICLCENCHRKVHAGVISLRSQADKAAVS